MSEDKSDLTRITDLEEFVHEDTPELDSIFGGDNSKNENQETTTDFEENTNEDDNFESNFSDDDESSSLEDSEFQTDDNPSFQDHDNSDSELDSMELSDNSSEDFSSVDESGTFEDSTDETDNQEVNYSDLEDENSTFSDSESDEANFSNNDEETNFSNEMDDDQFSSSDEETNFSNETDEDHFSSESDDTSFSNDDENSFFNSEDNEQELNNDSEANTQLENQDFSEEHESISEMDSMDSEIQMAQPESSLNSPQEIKKNNQKNIEVPLNSTLKDAPSVKEVVQQEKEKIYTELNQSREKKWENFSDIKNYIENYNGVLIELGGNPPFSILIEFTPYSNEAKKIVEFLIKNQTINSNDKEIYLQTGKILIPQVSEYSAHFLGNQLRRFDAKIHIGHAGDIYSSSVINEHGKGHSHAIEKNRRNYYYGENISVEDIIINTHSEIPNKEIDYYMGFVHASTVIQINAKNSEEDISKHEEHLINQLKKKAHAYKADAIINYEKNIRKIDDHKLIIEAIGNAVCTKSLNEMDNVEDDNEEVL